MTTLAQLAKSWWTCRAAYAVIYRRTVSTWWTLSALLRPPPACRAGALLNELKAHIKMSSGSYPLDDGGWTYSVCQPALCTRATRQRDSNPHFPTSQTQPDALPLSYGMGEPTPAGLEPATFWHLNPPGPLLSAARLRDSS